MNKRSVFFALFFYLGCGLCFSQVPSTVSIWEDTLTLPAYVLNPNDVNPMFFNNESYQGASRVIYPYPAMDNFTSMKKNQVYKALYLENEYVKLCVLPELGGRLFYATDKTNEYEIFYRQHVIKPAHIGMLGAWISGGIEWCVFHHHRASTFLPVDYTMTEQPDGSKTIWIGETEPRHRMKWTIGITLRPGSSLIEVNVRLFNRTEIANSILYWANVATHVNNEYQVIFPPSVDVAVYHAKNSFAHWPITHEVYNGYDHYKNGIDASWWKNHPAPISFFAHNLKEGFLAGYDYGKDAGTMHVADPHVVTGAKLWEWGPGPEGSFWDTKLLTDTDGPYAELMVGAWSDNQPDYGWIKPYEFKEFTQYWYPIRNIRGAKNANKNAAVNLDILPNGKVLIGFNTTHRYENVVVNLAVNGKTFYTQTASLDPAKPFIKEIEIPRNISDTSLSVRLSASDGKEIISYRPKMKVFEENLPEEVSSSPPPKDISTTEELYFTGLRIKQFHHARLRAMDYFEEALRRDPLDSRSNNEAGLYYMNRGHYDSACYFFRKAIIRPVQHYTRPLNGESLYYLGLTLEKMGNYEDAYDTLYRSAWDYSFHAPAYFHLARISCIKKDYPKALEHINNSLIANSGHIPALHLKSGILRILGSFRESEQVCELIHKMDPLDAYHHMEKYLVYKSENQIEKAEVEKAILVTLLRDYYESYLEMAVEYMNSGLYPEATEILQMAASSQTISLKNYPMIHYYLGYLYHLNGDRQKAIKYFDYAGKLSTDYCFPYRLESMNVLNTATELSAEKSKAHYYLGNVLYDKLPGEAIKNWKKAVEYQPDLAIACRNLGWGLYHHENNVTDAIKYYELAIEHNPSDALYYYELDILYELNNTDPAKRLKLLTWNHDSVKKRSDALSREIKALVQNGMYDKAIEYLQNYNFYARELADDLHEIYVNACLLRGKTFLKEGKTENAIHDFLMADQFPENHQTGRSESYIQNARIWYLTGIAYEKSGDKKKAKEFYIKSAGAGTENSDCLYEQALSFEKLGEKEKAAANYQMLIELGTRLSAQESSVDFFAKFGEELTSGKRIARGYYFQGLGQLGKGNRESALELFTKALEKDNSLVWAFSRKAETGE